MTMQPRKKNIRLKPNQEQETDSIRNPHIQVHHRHSSRSHHYHFPPHKIHMRVNPRLTSGKNLTTITRKKSHTLITGVLFLREKSAVQVILNLMKMMNCRAGALITTTYFASTFISDNFKPCLKLKKNNKSSCSSSTTVRILCSSSSPDLQVIITEKLGNDASLTGGAYDFERATKSLTQKSLFTPKKVTLVRHGLSTWNEEGRVQGSSNLSTLTETGVAQAERCRRALADTHFDYCFSSPISRAKSTAEIIWQGRDQPLVFLDSLKEAHLYFLEGMKNVDAMKKYPKEYSTWREDPSNFIVNGIYPVLKLWGTANEAWKEILFNPGENFLVVTHKSMLRALICTALGLGPERFRAFEVNNGGLCVFNFNKKGEAMLQSLNMTAHMYSDHIYRYQNNDANENKLIKSSQEQLI